MLMSFEEAAKRIENGEVLHIAATEALLRKLPKGKWAGGSTEYFMAKDGGRVSGDLLFVTEFPYGDFSVKTYDSTTLCDVAADAYDNGFSIVIIPFDSDVHKEYAENASGYKDLFMKDIAGWISGINLGASDQTPIAVNGVTGEAFPDKAVALHIGVPADKTVSVNIVNIFEQDEDSPLIKFVEDGFSATKCLIDGKETIFADYIAEHGIDTKLPIIGNYSGAGINTSFRSIDDGVVSFYAPVFDSIEYRFAKKIPDYAEAFHNHLGEIDVDGEVFSCNCILNFLYGEFEGKSVDALAGPITFGEIAYQLVNKTLVYVVIR